MNWWRRPWDWVFLTVLEGRLQRAGYRRLHEQQVAEATERSKQVVYDLADAVIMLRTVSERIEEAITEMTGEGWDE